MSHESHELVDGSTVHDCSARATCSTVKCPSDVCFDLSEILKVGHFELKKVPYLPSTLDDQSDLVPGVYEGGLKVWEGSIDLSLFLIDDPILKEISKTGNCLELGCGHGFPGICALKIGFSSVFFSDFNEEVLDSTWRNIILNFPEERMLADKDVKCFAGDWLGLSGLLGEL